MRLSQMVWSSFHLLGSCSVTLQHNSFVFQECSARGHYRPQHSNVSLNQSTIVLPYCSVLFYSSFLLRAISYHTRCSCSCSPTVCCYLPVLVPATLVISSLGRRSEGRSTGKAEPGRGQASSPAWCKGQSVASCTVFDQWYFSPSSRRPCCG